MPGGIFFKVSQSSRRYSGANKLKSVFRGGVYATKNTLRAVECCSPAKGGARRETQRKFTCPPARPEGK